MSCAGCSLLITVGAQVVVVADQTFVTTSSEVAFKTRIAAHTFMATHYFSLRGRAYTHNCDNRTHTLSRSVRAIFGDTVLCVASSFPSLLQQRCSYYFFPAAGPPRDGDLVCHPKKVIIFRFAPFTCGSRSCSAKFSSLISRSSHPCETFHHYFRVGAFAFFIFSLLPRLSRQNRKTNEPMSEKKNHGTAALSHTHHTGRRWQSHNRVCKIFPPFCHTK